MNSGGLAFSYRPVPPSNNPQQSPLSEYYTFPSQITTMSNGRKRKADDELPDQDRMSFSPSPAPSRTSPQRQNPSSSTSSSRTFKRPRMNVVGRPLALPRLLETLSADEMRSVLTSICGTHPDIGAEILTTAPRPSVQSALNVLRNYLTALRDSFPYGNKPTSEYTFNRIRPSLMELLDALNDFTPHFLPPNEAQAATSLDYLDSVTNIIHELPDWDNFQHDRYKHEAYEEIAKYWACVIREASKKGAGIQMQIGGWDRKLASHNQSSGGRLKDAVDELRKSTEWYGNETGLDGNEVQDERQSLRDQILGGTYGVHTPIQVGPW